MTSNCLVQQLGGGADILQLQAGLSEPRVSLPLSRTTVVTQCTNPESVSRVIHSCRKQFHNHSGTNSGSVRYLHSESCAGAQTIGGCPKLCWGADNRRLPSWGVLLHSRTKQGGWRNRTASCAHGAVGGSGAAPPAPRPSRAARLDVLHDGLHHLRARRVAADVRSVDLEQKTQP